MSSWGGDGIISGFIFKQTNTRITQIAATRRIYPRYLHPGTDAAGSGAQIPAARNGYLKRKITRWKLRSLYSQEKSQLVPLDFLRGYFSSAGSERFVLRKQIPAPHSKCCLVWSNQPGSIKSSAVRPKPQHQLRIQTVRTSSFITVLIINPQSFFRT